MTPCKRKCHDCGNIAQHEDNIRPFVNCKKCGSQDTRLIRDKTVEPEQSYDQVLLRKNLPPLPDGWCGPWSVDGEAIVDSNGHIIAHVYDYGHRTPEFIAELLNVTHPAP